MDSIPLSSVLAGTEEDFYVVTMQDIEEVPSAPNEVVPASTINDPLYPKQWALPYTGIAPAILVSDTSQQSATVCVIDSGVAHISELNGRNLTGYDFVQNDAVPQDEFGHGTAVASIIAANLDGIGMAGVAVNARILPLRTLDAQGRGTYSSVAAALTYCADNGGQIANLSLGGTIESDTLKAAIDYAIQKNVVVIAAAGNHAGTMALFPARYEPVVAVGSIDPDGTLSSFSSKAYDLLAPGRDILVATIDGRYVLKSGTNFAAPHGRRGSLRNGDGRTLRGGQGYRVVDAAYP